MFSKIILILLISIFLFSFRIFSQDSQLKTVDINALVSMMEGSFSSEEQSKNDSDYLDIRLHMKRIWTDRGDGKWLYVEQAIARALEEPYKQRVYKIFPNDDGSFESTVFIINNPLRFAGEWQKENPLSELTPDSLIALKGCSVYIKLINDSTFQGNTIGNDCPCDLQGAEYATTEVEITKQKIIIWARGFDKRGNQVWGAEGGYIFKKID